MKFRFILLGLLSFLVLGATDVYGTANAQETSQFTDRVIIQMKDAKGNEVIDSVPWSDLPLYPNAKVLQPDYIRSVATATTDGLVTWATDRVGFDHMKNQFTIQPLDIVVAVVDTGIDYNHPFLADRIVPGYDFVDNDNDPMDEHFHGTHIAGILTEITTENVKIMPVRTLDKDGNGYDTDIAKGIRYAVDHGASVINMSFEGEGFSTYLSSAISYAVDNGVLVIVAAGNAGDDTSKYYPASEEKAIVVSATDRYDSIASFSNTGDSIDMAAPGVEILSSIPNNEYGEMDGTSMATPFVSGLAAMLVLDNPKRTRQEIEELLLTFVDDVGDVGWDPKFGYGIVDVTSFEKFSLIKEVYQSNDYKEIPTKSNVSLTKEWKVRFNGTIQEDSIVSVRIFNDIQEVPASYEVKAFERQLLVRATESYTPNVTYVLEIVLKGNKKYLMQFTTVSD